MVNNFILNSTTIDFKKYVGEEIEGFVPTNKYEVLDFSAFKAVKFMSILTAIMSDDNFAKDPFQVYGSLLKQGEDAFFFVLSNTMVNGVLITSNNYDQFFNNKNLEAALVLASTVAIHFKSFEKKNTGIKMEDPNQNITKDR